MTWPLSQDYNEAIQAPAANFADPDLRRGQAATNQFGVPMPCSGNFADVYLLQGPDGSRWAVKCFTRETPGLRERYAEISRHLRGARLPFTMDFDFLEQGIRVHGQWFPVLKMQWVEGLTLNQFVAKAADKPATLEALLQIWARMGQRLRDADVAHADLQHGNVLLVPGSGASSLALKLVDYDGMWVPALAGTKSGEVGHPSYQHPQRLREETYNREVDRFPLLLIATALAALKSGGRELWEKYDNGDNLLFTQEDLDGPSKSRLIYGLLKGEDAVARGLAEKMIEALRGPLEETALLDEITPVARPTMGRPAAPVAVKVTPPVLQAGAAVPDETPWDNEDSAPASPVSARQPKPKASTAAGVPVRTWIAVGSGFAASFIVLCGVACAVYFAARGQARRPTEGPALARNAPTDTSPRERADPAPSAPPEAPKDTDGATPKAPDLPVGTEVVLLPSAEQVRTVRVFKTYPDALAISPDGQTVVCAGGDAGQGPAVMWTAGAWDSPKPLAGHKRAVFSLAFSPNGMQLLSGSIDWTVRLWDIPGRRGLKVLTGHTAEVDSVAFLPGGKGCVSGSRDGTLRVWEGDDLKCTKILQVGTRNHTCLACLPDGRRVLLGDTDAGISVWDIRSGERLYWFADPSKGMEHMVLSPDSSLALSGHRDGVVRLWDVTKGQVLRSYRGHTGPVPSVAFMPNQRYLASGGVDRTIRLWDRQTGGQVGYWRAHDEQVKALAFYPDGRLLLSAGWDNQVTVWRIAKGGSGPPVSSPPKAHRDRISGYYFDARSEGESFLVFLTTTKPTGGFSSVAGARQKIQEGALQKVICCAFPKDKRPKIEEYMTVYGEKEEGANMVTYKNASLEK